MYVVSFDNMNPNNFENKIRQKFVYKYKQSVHFELTGYKDDTYKDLMIRNMRKNMRKQEWRYCNESAA